MTITASFHYFDCHYLRSQLLRSLAALILCLSFSTAQAEDDWQHVERIVVVGDIHGDYTNYLQVLKAAGLVNRRGNWSAGKTHLVQMGDLPDRGPDTDKIISHIQKLEKQAARAGGMVHLLIGNHEAMNISGDLRYVHPGEYKALISRQAQKLQDNYYARFVEYLQSLEEPPLIDENFRAQWNLQYPLGYVEHRIHWSPKGDFGSWVLQHNTLIRINNILFVHGGIGPAAAGFLPMRTINDQIRSELANYSSIESPLFEAPDGPLWYRGLALHSETEELPHLQSLLDYYQVDHIVVGHTPGYGTIIPRFDGKVLVVDAGISAYYGGHLASLLIEKGKLFNIQRGETIPIPASAEATLEYYRHILLLEPDTERLRQLVYTLEHPEAVPVIEDSLIELPLESGEPPP